MAAHPIVLFTPEDAMQRTASTRRARITTFGNLKGGSGKTTNAVNIACLLAHGTEFLPPQRVLLVDLEPVRTASTWLGVSAPSQEQSSFALFDSAPRSGGEEARSAHKHRLRTVVQRAEGEPLDVVPAHGSGLDSVDNVRSREYDLKDNLALLAEDYDHVVIDLPGSRTGRLLRSALIASDGVLVPILPEGNAAESSMPFFDIVEEIRRGANPTLQVDGVIISRAGHRNDLDAQITHESLLAELPYPVFESRVRTLKGIQRASTFRVSVAQMGSREALEDYVQLVHEWMGRVQTPGVLVA